MAQDEVSRRQQSAVAGHKERIEAEQGVGDRKARRLLRCVREKAERAISAAWRSATGRRASTKARPEVRMRGIGKLHQSPQ
jgi:hypothetical protein